MTVSSRNGRLTPDLVQSISFPRPGSAVAASTRRPCIRSVTRSSTSS
jgi:hypothetical protein